MRAALAAVAVAAALFTGSAAAAPIGEVEDFDVGCSPRGLISGPGASIWFTCFHSSSKGGRGKVGLITQTGKVLTFGQGIDPNSEPRELVAGPDGNVWFTINTGINLLPRQEHPAAIGRVAPSGQVTTFRAGLSAKAVLGDIVAGPDGNVWFTEGGRAPAIGRITPSGEITEFRAGLGGNPGALVAGPDGNLWFPEAGGTIARITPAGAISEFGPPASHNGSGGGVPALGPEGNLWLTGDSQRPAIFRVDPSGAMTEFSAGLNPAGNLLSPLVAGPDGAFWFTARGQIRGAIPVLSIARVTPSGEITEFKDCLHEGPPFTGPETIVAGPDGNLWFTSVTTRSLPNIGTPPAIGRITPSGAITEFREGVFGDPKMIVAGPDGGIWFAGTSGESISRIQPSDQPANTFLVERAGRASRGGVAKLPITVPGPGRIEVEPRALLLRKGHQRELPPAPSEVTATACGLAQPLLQARGPARAQLRRKGSARIAVRVTFTPDGGAPYSRDVVVGLRR